MEMAGFAMSIGSMLAAAAAGELVSRLTSFLERRYSLNSGVEWKLQRLRELLLEINSVVGAAENREIENKKLMEWLMELKDVVNQAGELMHAFKDRLLEKKPNDETVSSFAPSSSNPLKRICIVAARYTFLSRNEDVSELNSILERLERMGSRVGNVIQLLKLDEQSNKPAGVTEQQLLSCPLPSYQHGFEWRVKAKEEVVSVLLRTEPCGAGDVPVLPILGIGGIGKTTLAMAVYNDVRVNTHFSLKMWVCVSDNFDVFRLTREILDQSGWQANSYAGPLSFNRLQQILKDKLSSQKFLLVLDDIWNETEKVTWNALKAPLLHGEKGSMIVLTSRLPSVARLMGTMEPIELEGLPEDEIWSFFKACAFGGANLEEHPRLVDIGRKIASKLKGSPLAAKTVGAMLKDNLDVDHWESIKSAIWELEKCQDGIMATLKLSYLSLPAHLQPCFAYLSVYPEDWVFKRDDVIQMWIAQGMIQQDTSMKKIKDIGEDYYNELISKSFFQPIAEDLFRIHDLLHDFAESVSKDNCFRIEGYDEFKTIPLTVRHLFVDSKHLPRLKENTYVLNNLYTLILSSNFPIRTDDADIQGVRKHLKNVRVLRIEEGNTIRY